MKRNKSCSRSVKVASEIKRVVSDYLVRGEIKSCEGVNPLMIVITDVVVSSCLQYAKIFVSSIDEGRGDDYVKFLEFHSARIRKVVGDNVKLKFVPELRFIEDTSFQEAQRIEDLLKRL